jgi:hypothetical protein
VKLSRWSIACVLSAAFWVLLPGWVSLISALVLFIRGMVGGQQVRKSSLGSCAVLCVMGLHQIPFPWELDAVLKTRPASAEMRWMVVGDPVLTGE